MDDVDIERELYGTFAWRLSDTWSIFADGNYDLDRESLRDYRIALSKRTDYLTYTVDYDFTDQDIGFGVAINGLTGGTDPPDTDPVVTEEEIRLDPEWVHEEKSGDL
jgi:hypothetical protein